MSNHGTLADQSQQHRTMPDQGKPSPETNSVKPPKIEIDKPIGPGDEQSGKHRKETMPGGLANPNKTQPANPLSPTQSNGDSPTQEVKSQAKVPEKLPENPGATAPQPPAGPADLRPVVRRHTYYTWEMKLAADGDERLDAVSSRKFKEHIIQNFQNLQELTQARTSEQPLAIPLKPVLPKHLGSDLLTQTSRSSC